MGSSLVALSMACLPAMADELQNWSFNKTTSELTFSLSDTILPEFFLMAEPPRLVLDIPETEIGDVAPAQIYDSAVQTIRVAQHTENQVRVVIELAPDIVLTPDQADIQFDDRDGQRYWRFRPLIETHTIAVEPSVGETSPLPQTHMSSSAASLALSPQPSTLPLDPYDVSANAQMVSVPPLDDETPPIRTISANAPTAADVPPMTVPVLGEVDEAAQGMVTTVDVQDTESMDGLRAGVDLPELAAVNEVSPQVVERPEQDDSTQPVSAIAILTPESSSPAVVESGNLEPETNPDIDAVDNERIAAITAPITVPPATPTPPPAAVPTQPNADNSTPPIGPTDQTTLATAAPRPTVIAPSVPTTAESRSEHPTVQQPAADRTIVQTTMPAPLTFGQPLPQKAL